MRVRVFVEGGGDQSRTLTECRKAFQTLFAGLLGENPKPKVTACGGRQEVYKDFRRSLQQNPEILAVLLVDAEGPVAGKKAWAHLKDRDRWQKPHSAGHDQAHLMVECMESSFLADIPKLTEYYGPRFRGNALPPNPRIESVAKRDLMAALARATRNTPKREYHKTRDGFAILASIDPARIRERSPYAAAFFEVLARRVVA